jgi:hypothetical protein
MPAQANVTHEQAQSARRHAAPGPNQHRASRQPPDSRRPNTSGQSSTVPPRHDTSGSARQSACPGSQCRSGRQGAVIEGPSLAPSARASRRASGRRPRSHPARVRHPLSEPRQLRVTNALCRQLGSPTTAHERRASRGTRSRQGAGASRIRASNPTEAVVRREPHRLLLGNEREHVARADQPLRRHARIRSEGGASGHRIGASALPLRGEGGARRVPPWAAAARPLQERRPRSSAALLALRMRQSASCSAPVCPFIGCTLAARIAS